MPQTAFIEIHAHPFFCDVLKSYLERTPLLSLCTMHETNTDINTAFIKSSKKEKRYALPVRIGKIIDDLNAIVTSSEKCEKIIFSDTSSLEIHTGQFTSSFGQTINLTEKEVEILCYLNKNAGKSIPKDELLQNIWNYADNVETHTLETHIYRLRQKIEQNPAQPQIIKTTENGYTL